MSVADGAAPAGPSAVVPRWEWRTFGDLAEDHPALALLRASPAVESLESYLLSTYDDTSAKVRDGILDIKTLQRVDAAGLQLWRPVLKAGFPLEDAALAAAFELLGAPAPAGSERPVGSEQLLDEVIDGRPDLRAVQTWKSRRRGLLGGCMVELTEMTVAGRSTRTFAAESPDPELVVRTVRRLGLEGRRNTCVAAGLKQLIGWDRTRFAVIDVGTNSVKFLLGERDGTGATRVELETAVVTRLGEGMTGTGELTGVAIGRTVDAIEELALRARRDGPVSIVAIGTAGLRQAPNRDALIEAVRERCDVVVEVISGAEEARLAHRAAVSDLAPRADRLLVFDSGGGSTQVTVGTRSGVTEQFSLDVGAVRVTERFGLAGVARPEAVASALTALEGDLRRVRGLPRPDLVIGLGGTATNLAAHQQRLVRYDAGVVHGTVVRIAEVDRQIDVFRRLPADARAELPGIQPGRAEVILGGACVVRTVLALAGRDAMTVSDRGLRHGVAAERFRATMPGGSP
ncbi:Ppx/GppA phosphatase family protein [Nocardioides sambongensis]|uniref:Ppx/GppA phosphatase family protein n=1 Tax=Nocardioides sambongensis TaxID=2589074 RepID=UPI00112AA6B7|nr:Ppx/GppA family phosphatase [Nocardioides sambongensis]